MVPSSLPVFVAALAVDRLERLPGFLAALAGTAHGALLVRLSRTQLCALERIGWPCAGWALCALDLAQRGVALELQHALERDEAAWHAADRERER